MGLDLAPYSGAISSVSDLLSGVIKRVLPEKVDEATALKINQELTLALVQGDLQRELSQLAINQEEAKSDKLFVSGWRPYVGWVCGNALAYSFIVQPFLTFVLAAFGVTLGALPTLDMGPLLMILATVLGVGTLRTYEKTKGVSNVPVGK
jgi:hypothetical protein